MAREGWRSRTGEGRARGLGRGPLLALGATLARRGPMAAVALVISAITVVGFVVLGVILARRGADAPVHDVPILASSALAWGGGFLLAFAASANALERDYATGIRHLFVARTTSMRGYLLARVGGLAVVLAAVAAGGTLVVSLVTVLVSGAGGGGPRAASLARTLQASGASIAFGLAFAFVVAPLALAALGARRRLAGYGVLLLLLVLPAVLVHVAGNAVPTEVSELCSVPSALSAFREALAPDEIGGVDILRAGRALGALLVFALAAFFFVRRDVILLEIEREPS